MAPWLRLRLLVSAAGFLLGSAVASAQGDGAAAVNPTVVTLADNAADDEPHPEPVGTAATANFDYHKPIEKPAEEGHASGGIAGAVENVARKIAAEGGGKHTANANWSLLVTPRLHRGRTDQDPSTVTLESEEKAWTVDSDMPPEDQAQLASDKASVLAQLGQWKRTLTPAQLASLDKGEKLDFSLRLPLAAGVLLSHPSATVSVSQGPAPQVVKIKLRSENGSPVITLGVPADVEVTWDHPYKHPVCIVHLTGGQGKLDLQAFNSGDDLVFRTKRFLPVLDDPEGLPTSDLPGDPAQ